MRIGKLRKEVRRRNFSLRRPLTRTTLDIDFTKSYNRLRQHVEVRAGQASGTSSKHTNVSVAPLPATNRPRASKQKNAPDAVAGPSQKARTQTDQLALLSKYNSRIANITMPYTLGYGMGGVATNRKGSSERANIKDKSDRATNEQVLDPRTRIILFKMINRGLIEEVNGCVSTGKEVGDCWSISLCPDT